MFCLSWGGGGRKSVLLTRTRRHLSACDGRERPGRWWWRRLMFYMTHGRLRAISTSRMEVTKTGSGWFPGSPTVPLLLASPGVPLGFWHGEIHRSTARQPHERAWTWRCEACRGTAFTPPVKEYIYIYIYPVIGNDAHQKVQGKIHGDSGTGSIPGSISFPFGTNTKLEITSCLRQRLRMK